jgi:hypothetical protein
MSISFYVACTRAKKGLNTQEHIKDATNRSTKAVLTYYAKVFGSLQFFASLGADVSLIVGACVQQIRKPNYY